MDVTSKRFSVGLLFFATALFCTTLARAQTDPNLANEIRAYASSGNNQSGNHLELKTDAFGFRLVGADGAATGNALCAPYASDITVEKKIGNNIYFYFRHLAWPVGAEAANPNRCVAHASGENAVKHRTYVVPDHIFSTWIYKESGVIFGALVVPFKFRLGGVKEIVSSSTVAPYIGWTYSNFCCGISITPILSAGLGLVPVADPTNNTTSSKSAFSIATGLVLTSSKNADFNAGVLLGKDFLGKTDRATDPAVDKVWISLYVGYKM